MVLLLSERLAHTQFKPAVASQKWISNPKMELTELLPLVLWVTVNQILKLLMVLAPQVQVLEDFFNQVVVKCKVVMEWCHLLWTQPLEAQVVNKCHPKEVQAQALHHPLAHKCLLWVDRPPPQEQAVQVQPQNQLPLLQVQLHHHLNRCLLWVVHQVAHPLVHLLVVKWCHLLWTEPTVPRTVLCQLVHLGKECHQAAQAQDKWVDSLALKWVANLALKWEDNPHHLVNQVECKEWAVNLDQAHQAVKWVAKWVEKTVHNHKVANRAVNNQCNSKNQPLTLPQILTKWTLPALTVKCAHQEVSNSLHHHHPLHQVRWVAKWVDRWAEAALHLVAKWEAALKAVCKVDQPQVWAARCQDRWVATHQAAKWEARWADKWVDKADKVVNKAVKEARNKTKLVSC